MQAKRRKQNIPPPRQNSGTQKQAYPGVAAGGRTQATARKADAKRRRRRGRGNYILYYLLFTALLLSAGIVLSLTVFFKIETITVNGCDQYNTTALIEATGIQKGDNLFRINRKLATQGLLEYPYIENVEIFINYPPEVIISITQAQPMVALGDTGNYTLISHKGRVLEKNRADLPTGLPYVTGFTTAQEPGQPLVNDTPPPKGEKLTPEEIAQRKAQQEKLVMLQYITKAMADNDFYQMQSIDISDRLNIDVQYTSEILIKLGSESDLDYKIKFAKEIILNHLETGFKGVVDVSERGKGWVTGDREVLIEEPISKEDSEQSQ